MNLDKATHFCNECKTEKSITNFYKASWCAGGYRPTCKDCRTNQRFLRMYGVTLEWFREQSRLGCKICGFKKPENSNKALNLDHCHVSGKARGVLCSQCNFTLGKYFDNIEMFNKVLEYLKGSK